MKTNKRWTPVRRGPLYCSPGCGGGCTWAAHQRAVRDATAVARQLGAGWKPVVWENLGWYWRVTNGTLEIRTDGDSRYWWHPASNESAWCDPTNSRYLTARKAAQAAFRHFTNRIAVLRLFCDSLEGVMKGGSS